jgi:hypothetical protein
MPLELFSRLAIRLKVRNIKVPVNEHSSYGIISWNRNAVSVILT